MANYLRRDTARRATAEKHHRAGSFSGTAPTALMKPLILSNSNEHQPLTGRFWRIYTDASAKPQAKSAVRFSGWGAHLESPEGVGQTHFGAVPDSFNIDDAELCAIMKALELLPRDVPALIVTDSSKAFTLLRDRHLYMDNENETHQLHTPHRKRLIERVDALLQLRAAPVEVNWFAAHQLDNFDVKSISGLAQAAKTMTPEALRMALGNSTADVAAAKGAERALLRFLAGDFSAGKERALEKMESLFATSGWVRDRSCAWMRATASSTEIHPKAKAILTQLLRRSPPGEPSQDAYNHTDMDVAI